MKRLKHRSYFLVLAQQRAACIGMTGTAFWCEALRDSGAHELLMMIIGVPTLAWNGVGQMSTWAI